MPADPCPHMRSCAHIPAHLQPSACTCAHTPAPAAPCPHMRTHPHACSPMLAHARTPPVPCTCSPVHAGRAGRPLGRRTHSLMDSWTSSGSRCGKHTRTGDTRWAGGHGGIRTHRRPRSRNTSHLVPCYLYVTLYTIYVRKLSQQIFNRKKLETGRVEVGKWWLGYSRGGAGQ
eukprot:6738874-Pyramimonas_sp.AAC.1